MSTLMKKGRMSFLSFRTTKSDKISAMHTHLVLAMQDWLCFCRAACWMLNEGLNVFFFFLLVRIYRPLLSRVATVTRMWEQAFAMTHQAFGMKKKNPSVPPIMGRVLFCNQCGGKQSGMRTSAVRLKYRSAKESRGNERRKSHTSWATEVSKMKSFHFQ